MCVGTYETNEFLVYTWVFLKVLQMQTIERRGLIVNNLLVK
jgi:hypothetical protein